MRVTYDPAADAFYIYVGEGEIAVTLEGAATRPGSNPMVIAFEILGRGDLAA
jgi:hypothetical protein